MVRATPHVFIGLRRLRIEAERPRDPAETAFSVGSLEASPLEKHAGEAPIERVAVPSIDSARDDSTRQTSLSET
jgi:hypothetical protein